MVEWQQAICPMAVRRPCHGVPRRGTRGYSPRPSTNSCATSQQAGQGWKECAHRSRHRMIANSWCMSVAILVMAVALQFTPAGASHMPQQVGIGAVQRLIDLGNAHMALPGPGSCPRKTHPVPPCNDMWEHWRMSQSLEHAAREPNPGKHLPRCRPTPLTGDSLALAKQEGWRELQVNTEPLLQAIKKFPLEPQGRSCLLAGRVDFLESEHTERFGRIARCGRTCASNWSNRCYISTNQQKTGKKKGWEAASMHSRHEQMSCSIMMRRDMREETAYCSLGGSSENPTATHPQL